MVKKLRGNKIRLSGAEQVCVMLKSWSGSWKQFMKTVKNDCDKILGRKLQTYEQAHGIKFKYSNRHGVYFIDSSQRNSRRVM